MIKLRKLPAFVCLLLIDYVASKKGQIVIGLHDSVSQPGDLPPQQQSPGKIDFSSQFKNNDALALDVNQVKNSQKSGKSNNQNSEEMTDAIASYLEALDLYDQSQTNSEGNVVFDKAGAQQKAQKNHEKDIKLIKDIIAVTIYFFIVIGLLILFGICLRKYLGRAKAMATPKQVQQTAMAKPGHRKAKSSVGFKTFNDEETGKTNNSRFQSQTSTLEPEIPFGNEKIIELEFQSRELQRQITFAQEGTRQKYAKRMTLAQVLDHKKTSSYSSTSTPNKSRQTGLVRSKTQNYKV